jgi:hypothetical protein
LLRRSSNRVDHPTITASATVIATMATNSTASESDISHMAKTVKDKFAALPTAHDLGMAAGKAAKEMVDVVAS